MELSKKHRLHDCYFILSGGLLGFLTSLFFLQLVYIVVVGEFNATRGRIELISFFGKTVERQLEAFGILLSFSLLGIVLAIIGVLRKKAQIKEEKIKLLERVNQAKTEFIAIASHQLRAPLTGIKWSLKMLLEGDFGQLNTQQEKILLRDMRNNERLIVLIKNLLDISRIEQHRFEVHIETISLFETMELITETFDLFKKPAEKKNISLKLIIPRLSKNRIFADRSKISQVIQNLLENAVNYTSLGGAVQLSVEENNNNLLVHVSDNGIGIPKEEQKKIFTKFFRAKNAHMTQSDGTGLGLYLCKTLVEMQDGKIWLISEENRGTTLSFSLPLRGRISTEEFLKKL